MITIGVPYVVDSDMKSRLIAEINIDGKVNEVWFEVDQEYKEYLTWERSDAFLIGLLHYAMYHRHDITCVQSLSEELYYQIDTYLIDAMVSQSPKLYRTRIFSEVCEEKLPCGNAVGTGISCGVDSLHAIACHTESKFSKHNVTHLAFNNVGSHGNGAIADMLYEGRKNLAKRFAEEHHYKFILSDSNIHEVIVQSHLFTHTFTSCFAVYCLQKLYSVYYYASGSTFNEFSLQGLDETDSSHYDLLLLDCFSQRNLRLYSDGANSTRLEKTERVLNFEPSYKFLNVCLVSIDNCGKCSKCVRTLLTLDALGSLDKYEAVFDISYYKEHRQWYYKHLIAGIINKNPMFKGVYHHLKKQIRPWTYISGFFLLLGLKSREFVAKHFSESTKRRIKQLIGYSK
jgi:hypothetical protein